MSKLLPEKEVENQIKRELERRGAWYVKFHADNFTPPGVPDLIACVDGKFVAIEVKAPDKLKNVSLPQQIQIANIRRANGIAFVANSLETFTELLDKYLNGGNDETNS